jgi:hypothetical protein
MGAAGGPEAAARAGRADTDWAADMGRTAAPEESWPVPDVPAVPAMSAAATALVIGIKEPAATAARSEGAERPEDAQGDDG